MLILNQVVLHKNCIKETSMIRQRKLKLIEKLSYKLY